MTRARPVASTTATKKALGPVTPGRAREARDRPHRPLGLRQVDLPALAQPDERADPRLPGRGRRRAWSSSPSTARASTPVVVRRRIGMVFQRSNPFPKSIFENVAYGLRIGGVRDSGGDRRPGRAGAEAGGPVGRGQGPPGGERAGPVGRPAAAAVHRPGAGGRAGGAADGRAGLRAGSHRHRPHRGADPRAGRPLHRRHRDPQHAAGGPRLGLHRASSTWATWSSSPRPTCCSPTPRSPAPRSTSPAVSAESLRFAGSRTRTSETDAVLAAIDVGTNAVRLEMARPLPEGSLETVHQERDPVRPGEGLFTTGSMPRAVADRLLSTLRRYGALCRRHKARVRAVATSAVREAQEPGRDRPAGPPEAGLNLEVISGPGRGAPDLPGRAARDAPRTRRSLCIDIGGGSTEVASAVGERPTNLWSVSLGAVRLAELFDASGAVSGKKLKLLRDYAGEAIHEAIPSRDAGLPAHRAGQLGHGAGGGRLRRRRGHRPRHRPPADPGGGRAGRDGRRTSGAGASTRAGRTSSSPGAVILEALAQHLSLKAVVAVDRGLRHGAAGGSAAPARWPATAISSIGGAARVLGRRFYFDERHASQVARIALQLFDELADLHQLPASVRPFLEAAALLHDLGNAVSYQKHHRHTQYLIQNADIPGLADRERELVARIARYHRRSPPELDHAGMAGLTAGRGADWCASWPPCCGWRTPWTAATTSPSRTCAPRRSNGEISLRIKARAPVDLELWDVAHEAPLFRQVFGRSLQLGSRPAVMTPRRRAALRLARRRRAGRAGRGCGGVQPTGRRRPDWLARELLARHADLLARDPAGGGREAGAHGRQPLRLLPGQRRAAAADARRASPRRPASQVAVLGDPHPENIGTYPLPDGGELVVDFNDFDLAGHGPYVARPAAAGAGAVGGRGHGRPGQEAAGPAGRGAGRGLPARRSGRWPQGRPAVRPAGRRRRSTASWRRSWPAPDTLDERGRRARSSVDGRGAGGAGGGAARATGARCWTRTVAPPAALAVKRAVRAARRHLQLPAAALPGAGRGPERRPPTTTGRWS